MIGQLGEQQLAEDALKRVLRAHSRRDHLVPRVRAARGPRTGAGRAHAGQLELAE